MMDSDDSASTGSFKKTGSNPLTQTVRTKLQKRRCDLNQEINKELMMRAGAENLFKAAADKKLKETVALELSFVNSNLQLLKEELAELNSSMTDYQNDGSTAVVPMIPLGLKETKDVDIRIPFQDIILEHYSEDQNLYSDEIQEFMDLRQTMRTPSRNEAGVKLLLEYYNQLYYIENRFFMPNRNIGIYFHWFDSLTGVPSSQRSVAFEKASVLFNIAALYTQIGAKQDRSQLPGLQTAIDAFQKAAGIFKYLHDNFKFAPSRDMHPDSLKSLVHLMLAQVQECVLERKVLGGFQKNQHVYISVAHEAAAVSETYTTVYTDMTQTSVRDYVPSTWMAMVLVKKQHFHAMAHYYAALAYIETNDDDLKTELVKEFVRLHVKMIDPDSLASPEDRLRMCKGHLHEALILHEDAIRVHNTSRQLRKIDTFQEVLQHTHTRSINRYADLEKEDDFLDVIGAPSVLPKTSHRAQSIPPDFTSIQVTDVFHRLGPLTVFSAKHHWSPPRRVRVPRGEGSFGFTVRGDSPVIIASVEIDGPAAVSGMMEGDFIVAIGDINVKWAKHSELVGMIRSSTETLVMDIVTPTSKNFLTPSQSNALSEVMTQSNSDTGPSNRHRLHQFSVSTPQLHSEAQEGGKSSTGIKMRFSTLANLRRGSADTENSTSPIHTKSKSSTLEQQESYRNGCLW